ncbi:hypothetical protein GHT06_008755 [Daphnia sinensis]|uniref:Uncharacterized protein n=1 Tax=Daphnia sinensis TaxID=1820382 RepID=A0AAD5LMK6_9CRUS|nr:hypothetical protein GHT06_008755 [Daphnia sinensis]
MEDESEAVNILAMGDSMSMDYGVLIAINSTIGSNCTSRFKNGCSPREKLHFRFWPGEINPSQTSQGLMALTVMLLLLCLVITYCCWGTCCKLLKRRSTNRRSRSQASFDSSISCASDPRLMMMWSLHHRHEMCTHHPETTVALDQHRNHVLGKPRPLRPDVPPPPYDALFGQEISYAPPTYSSLALDQSLCPISLRPQDTCESSVSSSPVVTVRIEREPEIPASSGNVNRDGSFARSQSVPAISNNPSQNKPSEIIFRIGNDDTATFEDDHEVVN